MRQVILATLFALVTSCSFCQRAKRIVIAVHADLIKTDNDGLFEKMQGGFEGSFYTSRKFALTTAAEWWSAHSDPVLVLGTRLCPIDEAFVRLRWLVNKDASFGAGFAKPLSDNVRLEAMVDYFLDGQIAIRGGVSYGLGNNL